MFIILDNILNIIFLTDLFVDLGDGNFHVLIFFRPEHPEEVKEAQEMAKDMALQAIALGGTCTGEHGVGMGKKQFLQAELGEGTLDLMKCIKTAIDPSNIMNPGKLIDIEVSKEK